MNRDEFLDKLDVTILVPPDRNLAMDEAELPDGGQKITLRFERRDSFEDKECSRCHKVDRMPTWIKGPPVCSACRKVEREQEDTRKRHKAFERALLWAGCVALGFAGGLSDGNVATAIAGAVLFGFFGWLLFCNED